MSEQFDPYHRWLGIPPKEQPPNHYRLLGIELFESNRDVIDSVATRHMSYLQEITDGPHVREAQRLLNELSAARRCLLDPEKKAAYDAELRAELAPECKPPKAAKLSATPAPPKTSGKPPIAFADTAPRLSGNKAKALASGERGSRKRERQSPATQQKKKPPMHLIAGGVAAAVVVLIAVIGLLLSGGGDGNDAITRPRGTTKRTTPATRAGRPPEQPAPSDTESSLAKIAAKVPLDNSPLPVADDTDWAKPADASVEEQPAENPPDAVIASDGGPARAASLLLWLDASDGSTVEASDDGHVQKWNDKSVTEGHAAADVECRPELARDVLSGQPVVRFAGSHCLDIEGSSDLFEKATGFTFVFVARGETGTLLSKGTGSSERSFAMLDGVASFHAGGEDLNAADDDAEQFRVRCIAGDQESLRWYVDGHPSGSYSEKSHAVRATSRVRIGAFQRRGKGLQRFFVGEIAELFVYSRPLAADEGGGPQSLDSCWG